ncbi:hypothetical protein QL285_024307 [Trifolium repens]|nr:hypothetical protein QL285_024307 [Trifolium repens]
MIQGSQTLWLGSQECFGIEISIAYLSNTQRETTRMEPNDATLSRFMRRQVRNQDKKSSNKSNKENNVGTSSTMSQKLSEIHASKRFAHSPLLIDSSTVDNHFVVSSPSTPSCNKTINAKSNQTNLSNISSPDMNYESPVSFVCNDTFGEASIVQNIDPSRSISTTRSDVINPSNLSHGNQRKRKYKQIESFYGTTFEQHNIMELKSDMYAKAEREVCVEFGNPYIKCKWCQTQLWLEERAEKSRPGHADVEFSICCQKGFVDLPLLKKPPALLVSLLNGTEPRKDLKNMLDDSNPLCIWFRKVRDIVEGGERPKLALRLFHLHIPDDEL